MCEAVQLERIRRLMADYCHLIDDGDREARSEVFTPDGSVWISGSEHRGRAAIVDWATAASASGRSTRHLVSNIAIELEAESASAVSDWIVLGPDLSVLVAGRYDDLLALTDEGWRFTERKISFFPRR